MDLGFISGIAAAVPQVTGQFNRKYQDNQLAIAEANARAAEATKPPLATPTNWIPIVVVAVVILGIVVLATKSRK